MSAATVAIRPYAPADLEACRSLWCELVERHREIYDDPEIGGPDPGLEFDDHLGRSDLAGVWVADRDRRAIGLCGLLLHGDEAEVEPIVVTRACRSGGIGRALLERALEEARSRGVSSLSIRPVARNVAAMALFHSFGFDMVGHVDLFMDLGGRPTPRRWKPGIELHRRSYRF